MGNRFENYLKISRFLTNVFVKNRVQVEFVDWIMLENTWKFSETEIYSLYQENFPLLV